MKATYTNLLKGTNFSLLGESGRLLEALYYGGKTDVTVEDIEELDRIVTFWLDVSDGAFQAVFYIGSSAVYLSASLEVANFFPGVSIVLIRLL